MDCTLMHGDVEVAGIRIDGRLGTIAKLYRVMSPSHMPVGTVVGGVTDGLRLRGWWSSRSIPAERIGIGGLLRHLDISDARALLPGSLGLSLSDHYWIRERGSGVSWDDLNFFRNLFPRDVGDLLFGGDPDGEVDVMSPDCTTDGVLQKRWEVVDGKRCLIKGCTGTERQEPFNEVIASELMEAMGIDHVDYRLEWISGRPYSVCEDFIDAGTELVSAYRMMMSGKRPNDVSLYDHYVRCCGDAGIDIVPSLDRMLVLDYIIGNGDRHTNNFGLIRDADTLEWLRPAPVFDSGTSLGCDLRTDEIPYQAGISSKPFRKTFAEQIGLVSSFDWIDFGILGDTVPTPDHIEDISEGTIAHGRAVAISSFISSRVDSLRRIADGPM